MFSKEEYTARRAKGLRGQGEKLKATFIQETPGQHLIGLAGKFKTGNRKDARKKIKSRLFTKKNYSYGERIK